MRKLLFILLMFASLAANSVEPVKPTAALEQALKRFGGALAVDGWFKGPGNLTGVAGKFNGQPMVFFTDPDGRYMLTGLAVDLTNGRNLVEEATAQYFQNFGIKPGIGGALPSPTPTDVTKQNLNALAWIGQGAGTSGRVAYVFFDFGCVHCMALYRSLSTKAMDGELRWIPIALSGAEAASKAALALGTGKLAGVVGLDGKALADAVAQQKEIVGRGALLLEKNMQLVSDRSIESTPLFIYEKDGRLVQHDGYASTNLLLESLGVR